ncbi:MAG: ATP-dependent DNA helicase [Bacteroidales bacterium]
MNILDHFQHINLTDDQSLALELIENFLFSEKEVFILKGYAGSGKTTIIKGIADYLTEQQKKFLLLSPTGRAAKVLSQKTSLEAYTIHKGIYGFDVFEEVKNGDDQESDSFCYYYKIRNNNDIYGAVIIVDEASMISNIEEQREFFRFGSGKLLNDLVVFSRIQTYTAKTKIIFVGDPAQLPPVNMDFSPALDSIYISDEYKVNVDEVEMKEVKRQSGKSGILIAAEKIRKSLTSGCFNDFNLSENNSDIFNPSFSDFLNIYNSIHGSKIIITYQNKTALDLNLTIRSDKYKAELPIQQGDHIIISKNNYKLGIMNGEFGVVLATSDQTIERNIIFNKKGKEKASVILKWRWIELIFPEEEDGRKIVKGYLLENSLYGENTLTPDEQQALYVDFKKRNSTLKPKTEEFKEALMTDLFKNAISLKFGYAVTCHKSQGGEWDNTFVFWDYNVKKGINFYEDNQDNHAKSNSDFYRWSYTAVTRASKNLYCINPPRFNSFSSINFIPKEVRQSINELNGNNNETTDIITDNNTENLLKSFGLDSFSVAIQDHFIKVHHIVSNNSIDIIAWRKNTYEIVYSFSRLEERISLKTWINGNDQFNNKYQLIPGESNSESLFNDIVQQIKHLSHLNLVKDKIQEVFANIEFDIEIEEKQPFLKILYDEICSLCSLYNINIADVEHKLHFEKYTFERETELAKIEIYYTDKGFFTYVNQIDKDCNSILLINDIKTVIDKLKDSAPIINE